MGNRRRTVPAVLRAVIDLRLAFASAFPPYLENLKPDHVMSLELALQKFPKEPGLKDGFKCKLRPLRKDDEKAFHDFFLSVPAEERLFIKHRVTEPDVIHDWCRNIDLGRNLPMLGVADGKIIGCATLHQQLGGWKRHIGRVSVLVLPQYRGRGLARAMVTEITDLARNIGLEK